MKIVIVDDEPKIRKGLCRLLDGKQGDWIISGVFEDAKTAMTFMKGQKTDVLLTDIRMPGISGLELIREVKSIDPDMRIIILSGYSEFSFAQRAIEMGVFRYFTKPTNPHELLAALQSVHDDLSPNPEMADAASSKTSNQLVQNALRFIAQGYSRKLSLEMIAEHLHITAPYLSELFKKHTGQNVTDYIAEYRIKKAEALLKEPGYKIAEISELVGFHDAKYFSVIFKKISGKSPQNYRNSLREAEV